MFPKCSRKKSKSLGTLDMKNANPLRISVLDVPNFGNPRRERDSNPRCLSARRFSRPVYSTTLPSLLQFRKTGFGLKADAKVMPFFGITKFFRYFFSILPNIYSAVSSNTRLA